MPLFLFNFFRKTSKKLLQLKPLEESLSYSFKNRNLLKKALTHKSFTNENKLSPLDHNERCEFLGDAVLELIISHLMMEIFPQAAEGDLSKLRAALVNEKTLADLARKIKLGDYLFLGRGENQAQGREKNSLLADAFEAVLGSIYYDGGFDAVFKVVKSLFKDLLQLATQEDILKDYKTKLQEISQDKFHAMPRYQLVSSEGPDHDKTFEVHLTIRDRILGKGVGKSKKDAEQLAAKEALAHLNAPKGRAT